MKTKPTPFTIQSVFGDYTALSGSKQAHTFYVKNKGSKGFAIIRPTNVDASGTALAQSLHPFHTTYRDNAVPLGLYVGFGDEENRWVWAPCGEDTFDLMSPNGSKFLKSLAFGHGVTISVNGVTADPMVHGHFRGEALIISSPAAKDFPTQQIGYAFYNTEGKRDSTLFWQPAQKHVNDWLQERR